MFPAGIGIAANSNCCYQPAFIEIASEGLMRMPVHTDAFRTICAIFFLSVQATASEFEGLVPPRLLAECATGKDGRLLEVPVRIAGTDFNFVLDTGSSVTCIDQQLIKIVGPSIGQETLQLHGGNLVVEKYRCPAATWCGLELQHHANLVATDLTNLRKASGRRIDGIIGTDVMQHYVISIDFDAGKLQVLSPGKVPPKGWGERIDMTKDTGSLPVISLQLDEFVSDGFLIDTGASTSTLHPTVCKDLAASGQFSFFRQNNWVSTAAGTTRSRSGRLMEFRLGSCNASSLRFDSSDCSSLGLNALSRFRLILDFPGRAIYVSPGRRLNEPDQPAVSGLALVWDDKQLSVLSVQQGSAADAAGLKAGDIIQQFDSVETQALDYFQVGKLLTAHPGRKISLVIQRRDRQHELSVVLAKRLTDQESRSTE